MKMKEWIKLIKKLFLVILFIPAVLLAIPFIIIMFDWLSLSTFNEEKLTEWSDE